MTPSYKLPAKKPMTSYVDQEVIDQVDVYSLQTGAKKGRLVEAALREFFDARPLTPDNPDMHPEVKQLYKDIIAYLLEDLLNRYDRVYSPNSPQQHVVVGQKREGSWSTDHITNIRAKFPEVDPLKVDLVHTQHEAIDQYKEIKKTHQATMALNNQAQQEENTSQPSQAYTPLGPPATNQDIEPEEGDTQSFNMDI